MTILYLDCHAGISGDMTVGALLDLGVPLDHLKAELDKLGLPPGSYELAASRTERRQVQALKFDVTVFDHHTHRHYAGIDAMLAASVLSEPVKERARRIFRRLAEAEALVHGVAVEDVHFHEVGAVDSIVDIVGTAICLDYLRVEQIYASALPLGGGFVETAHGRLPVPAPATAELLKGLAVHGDCGPGERVTPTGVAIVAVLASWFGKQPAMVLEKTGCGAGGKDFPDCPNILRAFLGKSTGKADHADDIMVAETNIDDSTPEQLDRLSQLLLTETSAIGLRYYRAGRIVLQRRIAEQQTEFGPVRFKEIIDTNGKKLRTSPEYEDCRRIAREKGIACLEVMERLRSKGASEP